MQTYLETICSFFGAQRWVVPLLEALLELKDPQGNVILHEEARKKLGKKLKMTPAALRQALYQLTETGLLTRPTLNYYHLHPNLLAPLTGKEKELSFLVKIDHSGEKELHLVGQKVST